MKQKISLIINAICISLNSCVFFYLMFAAVNLLFRSYRKSSPGLVSGCNTDCGCTTEGFEPVCVEDIVYFSPCHAGCLSSDTENGVKVRHRFSDALYVLEIFTLIRLRI